jgi:type IV secretory pathway TraG/TraD family ATPase VirD4
MSSNHQINPSGDGERGRRRRSRRQRRKTLAHLEFPAELLPTFPTDARLGTARFADPVAVGKFFAYRPDQHMWLGRIPSTGAPIGVDLGDRHALICGGSRSGKAACFGQYLLDTRKSLFAFSTKGDLASFAALRRGPGHPQYCQGLGQRVYVFDPGRIAKVPIMMQRSFNPLEELDPTDDGCIALAEQLSAAIRPFTKEHEQYWNDDARRMLTDLILHVRTSDAFADRRNLVTVHDLATTGDERTWRILKQGGHITTETPFDVMTAGMEHNLFFRERIAQIGKYYAEMAREASKQWHGVKSHVQTAVGFLNKPDMQRLFSGPHQSMRSMKSDPRGVSVFAVLDADRLETDFAFPRLLFSTFLWGMKQ